MTRILPRVTLLFIVSIFTFNLNGQETVTDSDGNVYNTVTIGSQIWLKENLKSLHYSDGAEIPGVAAYLRESNASIYGRLYTWDAAMRGSVEESVQGICPDGWHIPSHGEWEELENYLGGASVAGGKMKEAGLGHWIAPNAEADNSSGFTALPGGEFDAHYTPNAFRLIGEYAVFWTSTQYDRDKAIERYISNNSAACSRYDWYKTMKYSIRAVKDVATTDLQDNEKTMPEVCLLLPNIPNPFNPSTLLQFRVAAQSPVSVHVYDVGGHLVSTLIDQNLKKGKHEILWHGTNDRGNTIASGIYFVVLETPEQTISRKVTLIR